MEANGKRTSHGSPGLLLAFTPFAKWSPHFETDLEIIQNHLDAGGRARVLACRGELATCEQNPEHRPRVCRLCCSRFDQGMAWLRGGPLEVRSFLALDEAERGLVESLRSRQWRDIAEVRAFRIDGSDIGMAAISSLVSLTREPFPDVQRYRRELGMQLASAAMVHFSLRRQIGEASPDRFEVFNARFAALRPALRASQSLGVASLVHDRAGYPERYSLTRDTYPHDLGEMKREIEDCYLREPPDQAARDEALAWYAERRAGAEQSWYSFTTRQREGLLPADLDRSYFNLMVFNSSEDEFVAVEEWDNPHYPDQNTGLERLLRDLADLPRLRIYLRIHPNMTGLANSQARGVQELAGRHPNLRLIPADSPVSSYALVDAADLVLTYGSTIGIEACHAGKLSILMGRAMYEDLDTCIVPASHEAMVALIRDCVAGNAPGLPAGHGLGLVKYGHWNRRWGHGFRHVVPEGLFAARMVGNGRTRALRGSLLARLAYKYDCLLRLVAGWFRRGGGR